MELYLHFPFCASKCRYCDFASWAGMSNLMPAYLDRMLEEAAFRSQAFGHLPLETAYLGGGTPSLMPAEALTRLLTGIRTVFHLPEGMEFTSEANPGTLREDWLNTARMLGINRLSLGMQAGQDHLLRMLGRIHRAADTGASVAMLRKAGFTDFNLDLMFGLPGQTMNDWRETLDLALSFRPTHLSCYGLIPEENTPLKADLDTGRLILPEPEAEREMYDYAIRRLAENGYSQYEISNFALPGHACRHNIGYWRQEFYLGLGCAAASMLPCKGDGAYQRAVNPEKLTDYLQADPAAVKTEFITAADAEFETMMLGLRMNEGVSESFFLNMHGKTLDSRYGEKLRENEKAGLIQHEAGRWFLTRKGMDLQNRVLVSLMDD